MCGVSSEAGYRINRSSDKGMEQSWRRPFGGFSSDRIRVLEDSVLPAGYAALFNRFSLSDVVERVKPKSKGGLARRVQLGGEGGRGECVKRFVLCLIHFRDPSGFAAPLRNDLFPRSCCGSTFEWRSLIFSKRTFFVCFVSSVEILVSHYSVSA